VTVPAGLASWRRAGCKTLWPLFIVVTLAVLVLALPLPLAQAAPGALVLGTTTSLQASGLLDAVIPQFERSIGYHVTTIAVSTGQALTLGARGEVEILLVNSPDEEHAFMTAGHSVDRRLVLHDDLVVLGPPGDPADLRAATSVADALRRVATSGIGWASRADNSGPYQLEKKLWRTAGIDPIGQPWYVEIGQGIVPTLTAATERQAYTLADRRAWLDQQSGLDLRVVASGFPELLALYHVIVVNSAGSPWLNEDGARAFADFLLAPATQDAIRAFGAERYGEPIFAPDGGRTESQLVPALPK
jgi:tungstate transport system substrate-binding protein